MLASTCYVLQSAPSRETTLHRRLTDLGFDAYFPRMRRIVRHRGVPRPITSPRLPGYLFIFTDSIDSLISVVYDRHLDLPVQKILGDMRGPEPMRDAGVIEQWVADAPDGIFHERDDGDLDGVRAAYLVNYEPGQMLTVMTGPYAGARAAFIAGTPYKITLNWALLGRENIIYVDHGRIEGAVLAPVVAAEPDASDVIQFRRDRRSALRVAHRGQPHCGSMEQRAAM
jgi:hypothetical protein